MVLSVQFSVQPTVSFCNIHKHRMLHSHSILLRVHIHNSIQVEDEEEEDEGGFVDLVGFGFGGLNLETAFGFFR